MTRADLLPLLAVVAAALLLRVGAAELWHPPVTADAADYRGLSVRLAEGEGYVTASGRPTSWRPPGYPAFLAVLHRAGWETPRAARRVQAVAGAAAVAGAFWVGSLTAGPTVGLMAALFTAVDPAQLFAVSRLLSEVLFTLLLVLGTGCLLRAWRAPAGAAAWAGLAGLVLGAGILVRGALLGYPLLAAGALLVAPGRDGAASAPGARGGGGGWMRRVAPAAALLATTALVLAPWTARNARVHDAFVPVATQMGATFYAAQNPVDGYVMGLLPDDSVTAAAARLPEPEASRALLAAGARSLAEEPGRIPRLAVLKLLYLWVPLDWEILPWYGAFDPVYAFVLLACAVAAGLAVRARRGGPAGPWAEPVERVVGAWPVWLPVAYFVVVALVFYGSPRFRMPLGPLLAVVAAAGLVAAARRWGDRAVAAAAGSTALLLAGVAVAAEPLKDGVRALLRAVGLWG